MGTSLLVWGREVLTLRTARIEVWDSWSVNNSALN
jgi:hypothetical protein